MRNFRKSQGITLIALVITIIVLLILAGVTIAALSGDNGILIQSQNAKEKTEEAQLEEEKRLTAMEAATNTNRTIYTDEDGITVTIPEGFVVSQTAGENKVETGLVIIDKNGNEYVWIPVDGIIGENGKTVQNAINGEIILGRYVFNEEGKIDTENAVIPEKIGEELEVDNNYSYSFTELSTGKGNTVAKDINGFIESVRENKGYYIARFEASKGTNGKAESKYNKEVWTEVIQPDASTACQNLYAGINSDLVNSYAWDTAILFIQKYGQNNYSRQSSSNANTGSPTNTGISGDVQLNIYDMASNCWEWTTETYNTSESPCVYRGGNYGDGNVYTSIRNYYKIDSSYGKTSFRSLLYL